MILIITKFRHFLEGKEFTVVTDHHALCALPKTNFKSTRLQNWAVMLSQFKYNVEYSAGKHHPADYLSRYQTEWNHRKVIEEDELLESCLRVQDTNTRNDPMEELEREESSEIGGMPAVLEDRIKRKFGFPENWSIRYLRCRYNKRVSSELQKAQDDDPEVQDIKRVLAEHSRLVKKYILIGETLFRKETSNRPYLRVFLPKDKRVELIRIGHGSEGSGHFGWERTYERLARDYYWPNMVEDIREHTNSCLICAKGNASNRTYGEAGIINPPDHPMEELSFDVMGPYIASSRGHQYVFVLIDNFSKYLWTTTAANQTSRRIIGFLEEVWASVGVPKVLRTDNGRNLISGTFESYLESKGIKHILTTPYHPESNGMVERANRTLGTIIRKLVDTEVESWDRKLKASTQAINTTINRSTGRTPAELMYRFRPRTTYQNTIGEALEIEEVSMETSEDNTAAEDAIVHQRMLAEKQRDQRDRQRKLMQIKFNSGDIIMVKTGYNELESGKKLTDPYRGPYVVFRDAGAYVVYLNSDTMTMAKANKSNLKPTKVRLTEKDQKIRDLVVAMATTSDDPIEEDSDGDEGFQTQDNPNTQQEIGTIDGQSPNPSQRVEDGEESEPPSPGGLPVDLLEDDNDSPGEPEPMVTNDHQDIRDPGQETEIMAEMADESVERDEIGVLSGFFDTSRVNHRCIKSTEGAMASPRPINALEEGRPQRIHKIPEIRDQEAHYASSGSDRELSYHLPFQRSSSLTLPPKLCLETPEDSQESSSEN